MPEKENNNQWEKTIISTWNSEINTISSHLKARLLHIRPSRSSWFVSANSVFRVAFTSLRSRHFGSSGHRKKRAHEKTREGTRVSPSRAPVLSFATTSERLLRRLGFHLQIFSLSLIKAVFTLYWISFCATAKSCKVWYEQQRPGLEQDVHTHRTSGTLSNDDDDGSENVAKKINLRSFKRNRVYLDPLNMSNVGDFFLELNS